MSPVKILCQQPILEFPTHSYNLVLFENITGQGKISIWPNSINTHERIFPI